MLFCRAAALGDEEEFVAVAITFQAHCRVSRSDAPVLITQITGESGCGKELVAGAIHNPRARKEFAAIT